MGACALLLMRVYLGQYGSPPTLHLVDSKLESSDNEAGRRRVTEHAPGRGPHRPNYRRYGWAPILRS